MWIVHFCVLTLLSSASFSSLLFQGNFLLSGSSDKSAIVWDVARGDVQQQFRFHEAPTLVRFCRCTNVKHGTCLRASALQCVHRSMKMVQTASSTRTIVDCCHACCLEGPLAYLDTRVPTRLSSCRIPKLEVTQFIVRTHVRSCRCRTHTSRRVCCPRLLTLEIELCADTLCRVVVVTAHTKRNDAGRGLEG